MRADLIKRLERLEQRIPRAAADDGALSHARRVLTLVLAYDRGGLQEHESIMEGYARALGCDYRLFKVDMENNRARIAERHGMALRALFVAHGIDPEAAGVADKLALIGRLFEQVPERLRARIAS